MNLKVLLAAPIVAFLVMANASDMKQPQNWSWSSHSSSQGHNLYEMGVDEQVLYQGHRSLTLRGHGQSDASYGAAIQYVSTRGYVGRKVRFSGVLRTSGIDAWAGIWMRGDDGHHDIFGGDILPLAVGSAQSLQAWTPVSVVLEVGPHDDAIAMGVALVGSGQVWLSDLKFEMVDDTTPVTMSRFAIDLDKYKKEAALSRTRSLAGPERGMPRNLELNVD